MSHAPTAPGRNYSMPTKTKRFTKRGGKARCALAPCSAISFVEDRMREALGGSKASELWGPAGLIAATMRCVHAVNDREDNYWRVFDACARMGDDFPQLGKLTNWDRIDKASALLRQMQAVLAALHRVGEHSPTVSLGHFIEHYGYRVIIEDAARLDSARPNTEVCQPHREKSKPKE